MTGKPWTTQEFEERGFLLVKMLGRPLSRTVTVPLVDISVIPKVHSPSV